MEMENVDVMELSGGAIQRLDVSALKDLVIEVTLTAANAISTEWGTRIDFEGLDSSGFPCAVSSWNLATKLKVKDLLNRPLKLKSNGKKFLIV